MKCCKTLLLLGILCLSVNTNAQLSTKEFPISFGLKIDLNDGSRNAVQTVTMPQLDMAKIAAEDEEDEENDMPPRFGYRHKVDYNLTNSGTWMELPNGDKLWRLNVICPNAVSVNFCYDKFWIPEGGKFFVYSKDKRHSIGAFTSINNKGDRENIRGFATGIVYGNDVVLEYYQPKEATTDAIISIEYVVHGYRYICLGQRLLGQSCSNMVNINCSEGYDWQIDKHAVAMILVGGFRICTGSLINTTDLCQTPLFLTANHCIDSYSDALGNTDLDSFSFYWNYEAPGCDNTNIEPPYYSTDGATIIANNSYSDFALLQLSEDPKYLSNYIPCYLGWDRSGEAGNSGVCIHHPKGDVKKISTVDGVPTSSGWNGMNYDSHWNVGWKVTPNGHGMTQGGSSGSPLINAAHRVIGQLHGSNCRDCTNPNGHSYYGKFDVSWTGNESNSIHRRLDYWLDSQNTGIQTMEGLLVITSVSTMTANQELYSNIRINNNGQLTIQSDVELMGNSRIIVESGGNLIIDGGMLFNAEIDLKPGASLRIINGGGIDSRNGFRAPEGALVDVVWGKIL